MEMEAKEKNTIKPLIPKLILWVGLFVLLTYVKILWPLMFGYMREENVGFFKALSQFHLHSMAFAGLFVAIIIGYLWASARYTDNEC